MSQVNTLCETVQNSQFHSNMVNNFIGRWIDKLRRKENFTVEFIQLPSVEVKDNKNSDTGLACLPVNRLVTNKRRAADQPRLKSIQELKRCKVVDISNNDKLRSDLTSIAENTDKIPVRKKVPKNAIDESQNLPIGKISKKSCIIYKRAGRNK
jgi:hypothetical protein